MGDRRSSTSSTSSSKTIPTRCSDGPATWLWPPDTSHPARSRAWSTEDKKHTFVTIPLKGDDDDTILNNYKAIAPDLQKLDGGTVQLAGLEPIASALTGTIATDQRRMEVLALPLVAVVLFLVFGGAIAAGLPVMVGGLSIAGATGHPAVHLALRAGALFRPTRGFADRPGHRHRLRAFRGEPVPGGDRGRLRHRGRGATHGHDGRAHGGVLGGADHRVGRQPAVVAAGLREVADLCAHRRGGTCGAAVDHAAARVPGDPRQTRRRARRADRCSGCPSCATGRFRAPTSTGLRTGCRRPRPAKRSRPGSGASWSTS